RLMNFFIVQHIVIKISNIIFRCFSKHCNKLTFNQMYLSFFINKSQTAFRIIDDSRHMFSLQLLMILPLTLVTDLCIYFSAQRSNTSSCAMTNSGPVIVLNKLVYCPGSFFDWLYIFIEKMK